MRGIISGAVLLLAAFSAASIYSQELPYSIVAVARAMRQNRNLLKNVSAYTCLETVSRQQKTPKARNPRILDAVQVDVAVGKRTEIYSWPGEAAFSSTTLAGLVGQGFVATGFFDAFAGNVFVQNAAAVSLAGEQPFQGRPALRFTYILSSAAKWSVNWLGARGDVGTSGDFWVDKSSFRLLRLDVHATHIPVTLPLKALNVTIDYKNLSIGNEDTLIPSGAEILAVETNGTKHRDTIAFSQCHAFEAESKILASPADLAKAVKAYESHREVLPAGLNLHMTLETPIHTGTAKIGDALRARLDKAVNISPELTVPRGSVIKGRIRELRTLRNPPNTRQIGISFDEIDWPGHAGIFFAKPTWIEHIAGLSTLLSKGTVQHRTTMVGEVMNSTTENIWPREIPGVAAFFLTGSRVIPKGFQMTWRTRETQRGPGETSNGQY